jgi:hypothetical protein
MSEKLPSGEFSEAERLLIQDLREKGIEAENVRERLSKWTEAAEEEASADRSIRGHLELSLKRAKLYAEAGKTEEALENLDALRFEALQNNFPDLQQAAEELMDKILS